MYGLDIDEPLQEIFKNEEFLQIILFIIQL
jgi:hypothetical protein